MAKSAKQTKEQPDWTYDARRGVAYHQHFEGRYQAVEIPGHFRCNQCGEAIRIEKLVPADER